MDNFGSRIQQLRSERGLSQRALGDKIGVSGPTIYNWEAGVTEPDRIRRSLIAAAARVLHTTENFLLSGKHPEGLQEIDIWDAEEQRDELVEVLVPVLDLKFAAGPGAEGVERPDTKEKMVFQRSWLKKHRYSEKDLRIATVIGDSMQPLLWDGDKIVLDLSKTAVLGGKVYALRYGNELRVKRLEWMASGDLKIVSLNGGDEVIPKDTVERLEIIGQVVSKMGSGGL